MTVECERKNKHGVFITTYVETSSFLHQKNHQIKKHNATNSHDYDRRAQLLAHVQQLRCPNSKKLGWPIKSLRSKTKKRIWWPSPARLGRFRGFLCRLFDRTKRRWMYERVLSDGKCGCNSGFFVRQGFKGENTKANGMRKSLICGKLRKLMKGLSFAWKCKRGENHVEY